MYVMIDAMVAKWFLLACRLEHKPPSIPRRFHKKANSPIAHGATVFSLVMFCSCFWSAVSQGGLWISATQPLGSRLVRAVLIPAAKVKIVIRKLVRHYDHNGKKNRWKRTEEQVDECENRRDPRRQRQELPEAPILDIGRESLSVRIPHLPPSVVKQNAKR